MSLQQLKSIERQNLFSFVCGSGAERASSIEFVFFDDFRARQFFVFSLTAFSSNVVLCREPVLFELLLLLKKIVSLNPKKATRNVEKIMSFDRYCRLQRFFADDDVNLEKYF